MSPEGIEIVQRLRLRGNSGFMEFAETTELSRRSPRELNIRLEDLTKSFKWRAYVMSGGVPTQLHAQYLPQGKEKLLFRDILCLKTRSCLPPPALSDWVPRSKYYGGITKQMNFNYPRRWNQWKYWAKWHRRGIKCDRLHIFYDILAWNVANKLLQFARRSWTPLLSLSSPQRRTGKLKKNSFSPVEAFTPF